MFDKIKAWAVGLPDSAAGQFLAQHWQEVPTENKPGECWQKIVKEGETYHCHLPSGRLYRPESKSWTAVKNLGIVWYGVPYYLGASMVRHFGSGVYEAGVAAHGIYQNWSVLRTESGFNLGAYLKDAVWGTDKQASVFKPAMGQFYQALWEGVPFALLYTNALYVNTLYLSLSSGYALFNPLECRVMMEKVQEKLRPADVEDLPEDQIANLSVVDALNRITNGSLSLTQILRTNKVGKQEQPVKEEVKKEEVKEEKTDKTE